MRLGFLVSCPVSHVVTLLTHVVTNPTQKGALLRARASLHREEVRHSMLLKGSMLPFPIALGFNATIPAASRVSEYPALFPVL